METPVEDDGVVALRRWSDADAAFYAESSHDAEIQRFTTDPADLTITDVLEAIHASAADDTQDAFLICSSDGSRRLGNLAIEYDDSGAHLSYWIAEEVRGQGYATRALRLAVRWLSDQGRADRAELWTHIDNARSRRAAERIGFVHQGDRDRKVHDEVWSTAVYALPLV